MSYITPITKEVLSIFIKEIKKKEVSTNLRKYLIKPLINEVFPYFVVYIIIQTLIILLLIYIIIKLRNQKNL